MITMDVTSRVSGRETDIDGSSYDIMRRIEMKLK